MTIETVEGRTGFDRVGPPLVNGVPNPWSTLGFLMPGTGLGDWDQDRGSSAIYLYNIIYNLYVKYTRQYTLD